MKRIIAILFTTIIFSFLCGFGIHSNDSSTSQSVCEINSLAKGVNCKEGDVLLYRLIKLDEADRALGLSIYETDVAALYCDFNKEILLDSSVLVCVYKKKTNTDEIFARKSKR